MSDPVVEALEQRAKGSMAGKPSPTSGDPVLDALHERSTGKRFELQAPKPAAVERRGDYRDQYAGQGTIEGNVNYVKDYLKGVAAAATPDLSPVERANMAGPTGTTAMGDAALHLVSAAASPLFALPDYAITKMGFEDKRNPSGTYAGAREKYVFEPRTAGGKAASDLVTAALKPVGDVFSLVGSGYADIAGEAGASPATQNEIRDIAPDVVSAGLTAGALRPRSTARSAPVSASERSSAVDAETSTPWFKRSPTAAAGRSAKERAPEPRPQASPMESVERPAETPAGAASREKASSSSDLNVPEGELLKFEEAPATAPKGTHPSTEQARRVALLQKIGLDEVRESAVTGDAKAAATEYQTSKLDNAAGNRFKTLIDKERAALDTYGENIVRETGGSVGVDQSALHSRGAAIIEPLDNLKAHFEQQTKKLYEIADERAGTTPIETPELHKLVTGDQAEFLGTVEGEALLRGTKARMKSLGMLDEQGAAKPVTVMQAEQLKQYLGNQWQPRTSRLIRELKDAIDDDVTKAAGTDVYQQARAMRAQRARVLDDPKGISQLMDSSGPEGINRAVAVEKIPDMVASMPVAQMEHVINTLRSVPKELQPQAQSALAEIKAQFANRVYEAGNKTQGQWNAKAVTQYLANNAARMAKVFTREELQNFRDLNDTGHILKKDQSYPGAAVQQHNLLKAGAMATIRGTAIGAGAHLGPGGAILGGIVGDRLAAGFSERSALKSAEKRITRLSDLAKTKKQ